MANRIDVAKLAGVSPAVVSYVLNESNYVSEEKRAAVLKAVKELDYHPNYFARALKKQNGKQLLFLSDDIRNGVFLELAYEMESLAFEKGYYVTVGSCSPERIPFYTEMLLSQQCAGLFITNNMFSADQLNQFASKVPTVLFQTRFYDDLSERISVVSGDIINGMELLGHHLVDERGHRRIAYLSSTYNRVMPGEKRLFGDGMRLAGFLQSVCGRGLILGTDIHIFSEENLLDGKEPTLSEKVDCALNLPESVRPTALVVPNDDEAARCIAIIRNRGLRVPEDVAVAGFGGTPAAQLSSPQLTTVSYPKKEISRASIEALLAGETPRKTVNIKLPMTLNVRGST